MRHSLAAVLAALALLAPPAVAQSRNPPLRVGLSAGVQERPESFGTCHDGGLWMHLAPSVGLRRGPFVVEGRAGYQAVLSSTYCADVLVDPLPPTEGIHTRRWTPVGEGHGVTSELRLRLEPAPLPVRVGVGAGWLWGERLPFTLVEAGLHTRGALRLSTHLEHRSYRIPFPWETREWTRVSGEGWRAQWSTRLIDRGTDHRWQGGLGLRVGLERALR